MEMSPSEYIEKRLDDQINWYDAKSVSAQRTYKLLQTFEIIIAALIPFLSGFVEKHRLISIAVPFLGTLVVIIASLLKLGKYHENWLQYRQTCELLKHEKYLFLTGTSPYEEKSFQLLVERVESIISAENINWSQLATKDDDKR